MRVLQVYRDHFADVPGGIERHVLDLVHGLEPSHHVESVASARRPRSSGAVSGGPSFHVEREFARPGGVPLAPGVVARARQGFDVVHVHSPNPTGEYAGLRARNGSAIVLTFHADSDRGGFIGPLYRRWLTRSLPRFDRVIVASERLIARSAVLRVASKRAAIDVVPFGVDTQRFAPGIERTRLWGDDPVVLFVGRLRYYKGLRYLIEAMARTPGRLVVIGDGRERIEVERLGREVLGDRFVHRRGIGESELAAAYRSADVFCLPSTSPAEAFGLAALEAMACGIPVVTTEVGTATSEINVEGTTGRVVPPRDATALAEAIRQLLDDARARERMGAAARERVLEQYDRTRMLERIEDIYADVTDRRLARDG